MVRLLTTCLLSATLIMQPASADGQVETGVDTVLSGAYSEDWVAAGDLGRLSDIGSPLTFGGTFHHPGEGAANTYWILEQVWQAGATPVVNLEIFATSFQIAAGFKDGEITEWASGLEARLATEGGRSVLLAPLVEMNGNWVPWGMDPGNYQLAYRRVHEIVTGAGIDGSKARWVFGPNASSTPPYSIADYWPGGDVVDVVGLSVYNFGGAQGWWDVWPIMDPAITILRTLAPEKPYLVTQTGSGSVGGDKDRWIMDLFDYIAVDPNLVGLVYFNFDKEADWKVWDDTGVAWGWLSANSDARVGYEFPLTGWFGAGPIPFDPTPEPDTPDVAQSSKRPVFDGATFSGRVQTPEIEMARVFPE